MQVLNEFSDLRSPKAQSIVLRRDNFNSHNPTSLCAAFMAPEGWHLVER